MKNLLLFLFMGSCLFVQNSEGNTGATMTIIPKEVLRDKIMGGWAGQTIGVTFGGPTEFRFNGTMIQDYQPIMWYDGYLKETYETSPGLYDDIYMDLTFVDIFQKEGLDAPVASFANAYANAGYMLWHANQAGRYNILHGIEAPASGHWLNNPHADDLDFQIEADFAGLMSPGMPQQASQISDKIGHIMNYGDGWYGGVYVANMYALAFVSTDVEYVVTEGLKSIPSQSEFYQCIHDVITWYRKYPNDWKATWFEVQKKWTSEVGCPDGVFNSFNIDAKVNAAYVVMGLLYGQGDFTKTLEVATRCGQDSDCNPSTAGGILGTMIGYKNIPAYWKQGLKEVEDMDFKYTTISLNDAYQASFDQALELIKRNGGRVIGDNIELPVQPVITVPFEKSFEGHYPTGKRWIGQDVKEEFELEFEGIGFIILGETAPWNSFSDYSFKAELYLDGKLIETGDLPTSFTTRRHELFWKYNLPNTKHHLTIKLLNPSAEHRMWVSHLITYGPQPPSN